MQVKRDIEEACKGLYNQNHSDEKMNTKKIDKDLLYGFIFSL